MSNSESDVATIGATIAAALAVVTAVVSAWGAQRVVELEEDKQQPHVVPRLDFTSRYGLVLFRVENCGGGTAYDIQIDWEVPLKDRKGDTIRFSPAEKSVQIPVLHRDESISKTVDGHVDFFKADKKHVYSGKITYSNASGQNQSHPFCLDADVFSGTPTYAEESLKTHFEIQKIPKQLESIESQLKKLHSAIVAKNRRDDA